MAIPTLTVPQYRFTAISRKTVYAHLRYGANFSDNTSTVVIARNFPIPVDVPEGASKEEYYAAAKVSAQALFGLDLSGFETTGALIFLNEIQ